MFFSTPLDLDFAMMRAYPQAYKISEDDLEDPDEGVITAVLGKANDLDEQYTEEEQSYFDAYHRKFKLNSKPVGHLRAMARMDDDDFLNDMPEVIERMLDQIELKLTDLFE